MRADISESRWRMKKRGKETRGAVEARYLWLEQTTVNSRVAPEPAEAEETLATTDRIGRRISASMCDNARQLLLFSPRTDVRLGEKYVMMLARAQSLLLSSETYPRKQCFACHLLEQRLPHHPPNQQLHHFHMSLVSDPNV